MVLNPQAREKVWLPVRDAECTRCPLHREARTVCLLGDGPVPNKIMVIGEAPGAREDDIERPFSGAAGAYLDRMLHQVGLPRNELYITNAVRCRPPDNRTPTKSELKACSSFMQRELEIVQPDFLLLLGNSALQALTGKTGIMTKHGMQIKLPGGRIALPTVHPAAVLRNPGHEGIFRTDLLSFVRLVRGQDSRLETKTGLVRTSTGLAKLCSMLAQVSTPIAFDVETGSSDPNEEEGGLHPWSPNGQVHCVSFTWEPGKSYVVALEHPEAKWDIPIERVYEALNTVLEGKKMVGHNIKFDLEWMAKKGVNLYGHFDTQKAAHLLDENRPSGLKPLSRSFLGADEYEAGIRFTGYPPLTPLAIYNGKDTDYTLRLYHIFKEQLKKQPRLLRLFLQLTMPATRAFAELEMTGFPVDVERLRERHIEIKRNITELRAKFLSYVPEENRTMFNPNSPKQLGWFFYQYLKLPILQTTPTGAPSTAESVLLQLRRKHPAMDTLMELRKWNKYESTYTRSWLTRVGIARKPRLYTSYNLSGTVTGRLSSDMQQVPRDLFIRTIIGSRPGWRFIEADFSQVELRIAAMFSRDPALTKAFVSGGDPHRETAAKILGKPPEEVTKDERKMAKAVNFGFLYGMGWRKFMVYADEKYQTKVTEEEAQAYRKGFFEQYANLPLWHNRQRRLVRELGYVQSPIGRVRHLPTILSTDEEIQAMAEREAINSPVQGFASDLTVLSMTLIHERIDKKRARLIGNVHDSIMLEAKEDYAEEAAQIVKDTMENLPLQKLFGFKMTVPIEAEVTISQHWGEQD